MVKPYKHKLGELGPEHFDGDPIDPGVVSEGSRMQSEAVENEVMKDFPMPENNIQRQQRQEKKKP